MMVPDIDVDGMNIEEVVDEGESNQEHLYEVGSFEVNYSLPEENGNPSVETGAVDLFEGKVSPINSAEREMTGSPADTVQSQQSVNDESEKNVQGIRGENLVSTQVWLRMMQQVPMISIVSDHVQTGGTGGPGEFEGNNDFRNEASSTTVRGLKNIQQQPPVNCDVWFDVFEHENAESEDEMFCSTEQIFVIEQQTNKKSYRHSRTGSKNEHDGMFSSPNLRNSCSGTDKSSEIGSSNPYFADNLSSQVHIRNSPSHKTRSPRLFDE